MAEIFLDASYAIALSAPRDRHHQKACELADRLSAEGQQLITTRATDSHFRQAGFRALLLE